MNRVSTIPPYRKVARWSYKWLMVFFVVLLAFPVGIAGASLVNGNLPGGTSISVAITSPTQDAVLPFGNVAVNGSASIGQGRAISDTALVYVIDVSGSAAQSGGTCGTVLACELAAAKNLNAQAVTLGTVGEVGVAIFGTDAAVADVGPASGEQRLTGPNSDLNRAGGRDVEQVINSIALTGTSESAVHLFTHKTAGISTNFSAGISAALNILAASSKPNKIVIFMSDGISTRGTNVNTLLPAGNVKFYTFAVGSGSSCLYNGSYNGSQLGSLQNIADLTGGTCTNVLDPSSLPNILPGVIGSQLLSMQMTVDGNPAPISSIAAPLPQTGPTSVNYNTTLVGLTPGLHTICVTAAGSDHGGSGNVQDCHTITIIIPPKFMPVVIRSSSSGW